MNAISNITAARAAPVMPPRSLRTVSLDDLIETRNQLYHAAALCEAMHQCLEHLEIANGVPELLLTIENAIGKAAEQLHLATFPEKAGAAS